MSLYGRWLPSCTNRGRVQQVLSSDKEVGLGALLYRVALLGWEVCALGNAAAGCVSWVPMLCGKISQVYVCCMYLVDRTCIVDQTQR